jgi:hypothetical protein
MIGHVELPTCGLWLSRGRATAAVLDGDDHLFRIRIPYTDEEQCWDSLTLLQRDFSLDLRLVIPDPTTRLAILVRAALLRNIPVLVAPGLLVETIGALAFSRPRPPHYACILARLPDSRFRGHLRTLPARDSRQLKLL